MSPRWMARFDVGDTIIRYGDISFPSVPFTISSATQHNLQVSSGLVPFLAPEFTRLPKVRDSR